MFGKNPVRLPVKSDGSVLQVQEIFPTFQGEGPYVGWPAVFIRLGGCNLTCKFCDTEFESFEDFSVIDLLDKVKNLSQNKNGKQIRDLVVITGGEPLRQPIEMLCQKLLEQGYKVQIETNGTLFRALPKGVDIICSPKMSNGRYHVLRPDILEQITALKFIVSVDHGDYQNVAEVGQAEYDIPVYVQPMDELDSESNAKNLQHAVSLVDEYGYRLSLQTHKIVGVP